MSPKEEAFYKRWPNLRGGINKSELLIENNEYSADSKEVQTEERDTAPRWYKKHVDTDTQAILNEDKSVGLLER